MPTKDEIVNFLNELNDDERADVIAGALGSNGVTEAVLSKVNANGDKLFTLAQINESIIPQRVEQILPERLKNHVKRNEFEDLQAKHDSAKREIQRLQAEGNQPNPETQREWETKFTNLENQITGLNTELDTEKAAHTATSDRFKTTLFQLHLSGEMLQNGANPKYLKHAAKNCATECPQLTLSDDFKSLTAQDPTTRRPLDHAEIIKGWLAANSIYKNADPPGGGLPGAGPNDSPPPSKDPFDGVKSPAKQLEEAFKRGHRPRMLGETLKGDPVPQDKPE